MLDTWKCSFQFLRKRLLVHHPAKRTQASIDILYTAGMTHQAEAPYLASEVA
jgi:hypothetical protein